jgi:ABC-type Na+ efflux pump permease subunit
MSKTGIIARHEFMTAVRRLSYILLTISFPLLAILGIAIYGGIALWGGEVPSLLEQNIGYIDNTGLFNEYNTSQGAVFIAYNTSDEARDALLAGNISEYYYIPQDYLEGGHFQDGGSRLPDNRMQSLLHW